MCGMVCKGGRICAAWYIREGGYVDVVASVKCMFTCIVLLSN